MEQYVIQKFNKHYEWVDVEIVDGVKKGVSMLNAYKNAKHLYRLVKKSEEVIAFVTTACKVIVN